MQSHKDPALLAFPDLGRLCEWGRDRLQTVLVEKRRESYVSYGVGGRGGAILLFCSCSPPRREWCPCHLFSHTQCLPPFWGLLATSGQLCLSLVLTLFRFGSVLSNLYIRNTFFLMIITNTHHFRAIGMYRKASRNRKTTSAIVLLPGAIGV